MLTKRIILIALIMLAGFAITTLSIWSLAFDAGSSDVPVWTLHWFVARLPVLIGVVMIVAGFRMLSSTSVPRPANALDPEDPAP